MITGFLVSRVALSISTFLFGLNALRGIPLSSWFRQKWWLLGVLWVAMYALSYFWSSNTHYWGQRLEVKLPVLLLPLSFVFLPAFSTRQLRFYTLFFGVSLLAGAVYSVSFLINNAAYYHEQYRIAQTLPTPAGQDHIRFSLAIALYIIWVAYFWPFLEGRKLKWLAGILVFFLAVYLHILAAKSGLLALYLFFTARGIYFLFQKKLLAGLSVLLALVLGLTAALNYIPTFHQRVGYMSYTYIEYKHGDKSGIYGDIGRVISYDIAWKLIKQHPIAGVGTGDMLDEMKKGYALWYPQVGEANMLLPHNQFLTVALGCGIPAALLFAAWMFSPLCLLKRNRQSFFFFITWLILFFQLLVEPVLEVQYGVFVFLFFLLWQKNTLRADGVITQEGNG